VSAKLKEGVDASSPMAFFGDEIERKLAADF
jgi:hypothetical protein